MSIFDRFKPDPTAKLAREASIARQAGILDSLRRCEVPNEVRTRLLGAQTGSLPWIATLTPAELLVVRTHGLRPISSVSATCWMHYGWSWTQGHAAGWATALKRLQEEARAAGANAVLDVRMRTVRLNIENSMDFTLVGTAVKVDDLPASQDPVVATVPALEFIKLLEAGIVPTGIAIGAHFEWMSDWRGSASNRWMGNVESEQLSQLWYGVRTMAHSMLREQAKTQGNGVLAHLNFSQMFEREVEHQPKQYLARHIVVATTVEAPRGCAVPHDVTMVVDMHAGGTPLTGRARHHQSYPATDTDGAI